MKKTERIMFMTDPATAERSSADLYAEDGVKNTGYVPAAVIAKRKGSEILEETVLFAEAPEKHDCSPCDVFGKMMAEKFRAYMSECKAAGINV